MNTELLNAPKPVISLREPPDSTPLLSDRGKLRERWEADGYLYFRGVIDTAAIAAVRNEYLAKLKDVGLVAEGESEPVWSGLDHLDSSLATPISDEVWRKLVADPSFDSLVRRFAGVSPSWLPIVVHRAAPPAEPARIAGDPFFAGHQDGVNNFGMDLITCWVPLMDIDEAVGGLAVVPGTHKAAHYNKHPAETNVVRSGVFPDSAWLRPNYKAGDVLMFHNMAVHAGLPNRSNMMRLSVDIRFLADPGSQPVVGSVIGFDGTKVQLAVASGERVELTVDDETIVRGPKGTPVFGDARNGVLFPGAEVIAAPEATGRATLVRSVSRKFLDLPAAWFKELPANWVK